MSIIQQLSSALNRFLDDSSVNFVYESIVRSKKFREYKNEFYMALLKQTSYLLKENSLNDITDRIGKAENTEYIFTDKDRLEIYDEVKKTLKPLTEFIDSFLTFSFMIWVFNRGGEYVLQQAGVQRQFILKNEELLSYLSKRQNLLIEGVDETTSIWLSDTIFNGKKEGLTYREIANLIRDRIPETYAYRSENIAVTETTNALNLAEFETAKRNSAILKRWVTVGDDRVDPDCAENESQGELGLDDIFVSGHIRPPAHPYCRCDVRYTFPPIPASVWTGD